MSSLFEQVQMRPYSLMPISAETMQHVWQSISFFVHKQLESGKGVGLNGLGTWTLMAQNRDLGNIQKTLRTPVFTLSEKFARQYGIRFKKPISTGGTAVSLLNLQSIASSAGVSRDEAASVVKDVLMYVGDCARSRRPVRIDFPCVGALFIRNGTAEFQFEQQWSGTFESMGRGVKTPLLRSSLSRPSTARSARLATPTLDSIAVGQSVRPASAGGNSRPSSSHSRHEQKVPRTQPDAFLSVAGKSAGNTNAAAGAKPPAGKAKAKADLRAFYDMQRQQRERREVLERQADQAMLTALDTKMKEMEARERNEAASRREARMKIDDFNRHNFGRRNQAPAPDEFGNLFEDRVDDKLPVASTEEIRASLAGQIEARREEERVMREKEAQELKELIETNAKLEIEDQQSKVQAKHDNQMHVRDTLVKQMEERDPGLPYAAGNAVWEVIPRLDQNDQKDLFKEKQRQVLAEQNRLIAQRVEREHEQYVRESEWQAEQAARVQELLENETQEKKAKEEATKLMQRNVWRAQMEQKASQNLKDRKLPEFGSIFFNRVDDEDED